MFDASEIANYFIWLSHETGALLTNLKLQKLLYYSQGWYLAFYQKPLFKDNIEAWIHGPVVPCIYKKYKIFQWNPIAEKAEKPLLNPKTNSFLVSLSKAYFHRDGYELELMTHQEKPWINARKGLKPDVNSNNIISRKDMQNYFTSMMTT